MSSAKEVIQHRRSDYIDNIDQLDDAKGQSVLLFFCSQNRRLVFYFKRFSYPPK